jgi:hypothetical protein
MLWFVGFQKFIGPACLYKEMHTKDIGDEFIEPASFNTEALWKTEILLSFLILGRTELGK